MRFSIGLPGPFSISFGGRRRRRPSAAEQREAEAARRRRIIKRRTKTEALSRGYRRGPGGKWIPE